MLVVEGHSVFPIDIEEILRSHPKVAEAAVVGIPGKISGEVIRAIIVPKRGEELVLQEMEQFCHEHLADYEIPREILFKESLPKTSKGTIRKDELKK